MFTDTDQKGGKNWFSAYVSRWGHMAVGRERKDVEESLEIAKQNDQAKTKKVVIPGLIEFPYGQDMPQSVNKIETWKLKWDSVMAKLSAIIPVIGGFMFLSKAHEIIRESNGRGGEVALGGVMGIVGLAAITLFPYLAYESGRALDKMHTWADQNGYKEVFMGKVHWPGSRQR